MMRLKDKLIARLMGADASGSRSVEVNQVGTRNESTRIEWLANTLRQIQPGERILDAGAGERRFEELCGHLTYVAQDFGQYDGKGNQSGLQMGSWDQSKLDIVCDIIDVPEANASFDAIMCVEVLEHIPSPILAIKEFSRLLRSGGHLIITAPFCSLTHLAPYHFYTGFNRYFYETHLSENGFEILELTENGNYFEYLAQEIRRIPSMADLYSRDKPTEIENSAMQTTLSLLERLSHKDQNSSEMLHFGCHVRARKK